jgi:hypothetical protein
MPDNKGLNIAAAPSAESPIKPLAVNFETAARLIGVSSFSLRREAKAGRLRIVKFRRRVLVPIEELERLFAVSTKAGCHPFGPR